MDQVTLSLPTYEVVQHALRDLSYADRLVGYKMTASAGNAAANLYNLREAVLFLVGNPWDQPMLNPGFKGSLNWVDASDLAQWLRDVVGDTDLADAIREQAVGLEPYHAQNLKVGELVNARMAQYREVYDAAHADEKVAESE